MTERTRRDARDGWRGGAAPDASLGRPLDAAVLLLRGAGDAARGAAADAVSADAVPADAAAVARVMDAVRARPRPRPAPVAPPARPIVAHPARPGRRRRLGLAAGALAAAAALLVLLDAAGAGRRAPAPATSDGLAGALAPAGTRSVRFTLAAPRTARVELVGDFNAWRAGATPMRWDAAAGAWMVELELAAGRYAYSFVLDGERWMADPHAPLAPDDGFGAPSSVVVVGGGRRPG